MDVKAYKLWTDNHATEYALTSARLANTRAKFMTTDMNDAVSMIDASYHNAVISQQTPVERHEEGYVHWLRTGKILDSVTYANQKAGWLKSTNHIHKINAVRMLRKNKVMQAWRYMANHFKGLGPMKAAFTIAMLGFESVLCVDTNVAQVMGWDGRKVSSMTLNQYEKAMNVVKETFSDMELTPFMLQWSLFDYNRNTHETHEVFFKSMGTWM